MTVQTLARKSWKDSTLSLGATIYDAIEKLDDSALRIILVIDSDEILIGTISDGDIRRGLLKGLDLGSLINSIVYRNSLVVTSDIALDVVAQVKKLKVFCNTPC